MSQRLRIIRLSPRRFIITLDGRTVETLSTFPAALVSYFKHRAEMAQEVTQ